MFINIESSNIHQSGIDILRILVTDFTVNIIPVSVIFILTIHPVIEIFENIFQIPDTIFTRFHGIITQILRQRRRIKSPVPDLLFPVTIHRISDFIRNHFPQNRQFFFRRTSVQQRLVSPFDSIIVIHAQFGWSQRNPFIFRLRDIIKAGIIHNRRGSPVFFHEFRIPVRFYRNRSRRSHVMHQSQGMPDLVSHDISHTLEQNILRQFSRTYPLIHLSGLHETHVIH